MNSVKGMTFLEVLIALVILVTGILGAVAMQAVAKKSSFDAMQRSVASSLAQDIISRIRVNDPSTLVNYKGTTFGSGALSLIKSCNTSNALCSDAELAQNDLYLWEQALMGADVKAGTTNKGGLVGARGCISHATVTTNGITRNLMTVVISWQGRVIINDAYSGSANACGTAGDKRRQIVVEALII